MDVVNNLLITSHTSVLCSSLLVGSPIYTLPQLHGLMAWSERILVRSKIASLCKLLTTLTEVNSGEREMDKPDGSMMMHW